VPTAAATNVSTQSNVPSIIVDTPLTQPAVLEGYCQALRQPCSFCLRLYTIIPFNWKQKNLIPGDVSRQMPPSLLEKACS
jgi:hypothetical protein